MNLNLIWTSTHYLTTLLKVFSSSEKTTVVRTRILPWRQILINNKKTLQSSQLRPRRYRRPLHRVSACDCVTDESERLPWGGLLLGNGDHSPPVFFETTIFSKWVVLAIPPRRPPPPVWEQSSTMCLSVIWKIDNGIKLHLLFRLLEQLNASRDCISPAASRNGSQRRALQSISHSRGRDLRSYLASPC